MKIIGLDPSLVATGYAESNSTGEHVNTIKVPGKGEERLNDLNTRLWKACALPTPADLVVMEGLGYSHDREGQQAGLHWMIRTALWRAGIPFVVVAPASLKKFATGKGNAPKEIVMREVFKRWGINADDNNQADAFTLCQIGRCLLGCAEEQANFQREVVGKLYQQVATWKENGLGQQNTAPGAP